MIIGLVDNHVKLFLIWLHVELILSTSVGLGFQNKVRLTATLSGIPFQSALQFCLCIRVEKEG